MEWYERAAPIVPIFKSTGAVGICIKYRSPVIYDSLWSEQKVCGPYWPVNIVCHWSELARWFKKAGGPAGQCLLRRPVVTINRAVQIVNNPIPNMFVIFTKLAVRTKCPTLNLSHTYQHVEFGEESRPLTTSMWEMQK